MPGQVQKTVVCVVAPGAVGFVPCADGYAPQVIDAYLLAPDQASLIESTLVPFDYGVAGGLWTLAFTSIVALFLVTHCGGLILNLIKPR